MTSKRIIQEFCISIELVKTKEKILNMRITPINNQRTNNKPAFCMAVKRINTTGMTNLEKRAIDECMPELREMFTFVDGDIELGRIPEFIKNGNDRFFKVLSSTPQKSDVEKIAEFFPGRMRYVHSHDSDFESIKRSLISNAGSSIVNYLKSSNDLVAKALNESLKVM